MKKYKAHEVYKVLIDKMLEPHGSSHDEVLAKPEIKKTPWYQYYTWNSKEEVENFKKFFIFTLTKETTPRFSKLKAEREWTWFYLMYGLKENFKDEQELQKESSKEN